MYKTSLLIRSVRFAEAIVLATVAVYFAFAALATLIA